VNIVSGLSKTYYKPISQACPMVKQCADGTVLNIPAECFTRSGLMKKNVAKAVMLRDKKAMQKFGIEISHKDKDKKGA
jgi:hypothetical protein